MKKHKILYTSMSGEMIGGGQKSLFLLLERLDREKYKPFLICPTQGDLITKVERMGIETALTRFRTLKNPNIFSTMSTVRKLSRFIKSNSIDLIHTDAPRQTFYAGLAAKKTQTPLIWHIRISDPHNKLYDRTLASLSTKMIVVSGAVRKRIEKATSKKDKIVTIYNGINLNDYGHPDFPIEPKKEFGRKDDEIYIGTASQLIPRKGFHILIQAAAQVLKKVPQVRFLLVGKGSDSYGNELKTLCQKLDIQDKVFLTGYRQNIPQIISVLDIIVLPSTHPEGLSRLILEGMASSKPVIAADIGGNPEAVEDGKTGFIVPPGDVEGLAQVILKLIQDKQLRQQLGTAGRQRAEELFDIDMNVTRIQTVYEELLCRKV